VENGVLSVGDTVKLAIDTERRAAIKRNHSSAHLLQAALRHVLGTHVEQAGSYVDEHRVRFDFTHLAALTREELTAVEAFVNANILVAENAETIVTTPDEAKKMGAMALFGEKYGSIVRVVKMGEFSTELCGGTHLDNTGKAGLFKIVTESSVAAGVRRIEGITGTGVLDYITEKESLIVDTAKELKVSKIGDIAVHAAHLQDELKHLKSEIESLNSKIAASKTADIMNNAKTVGSVRIVTAMTEAMAPDAARSVCDDLKANNADIVVVIGTSFEGKLNFVAACGKDAVAAGAHAGKLLGQISAIAGGKGGGRPDSAMSGAADASKMNEALDKAAEILAGMVK
jgi:alanyl-tRNA synthetase